MHEKLDAIIILLKRVIIEQDATRGLFVQHYLERNPEVQLSELNEMLSSHRLRAENSLNAQLKNTFGDLPSIDDLLNNLDK